MKKRLVIIGIVVLIAAGAGVLMWQRNVKPIANTPDDSNPTTDTSTTTTGFIPNFSSPTAAEEEKKTNEYIRKLQEFLAEPPTKSLADAPRHATEDEQIPGITITKKGEVKLVVNKPQGYSIEIPSVLVMSRTLDDKSVQFFEPETMCLLEECPADISIFVYEGEEDRASRKKFLDYLRNEKKIPFETAVIAGKQGIKYYRESDRKNPNRWIHSVEVGDKIYSISITDDPLWRDAINSFKLITAQP